MPIVSSSYSFSGPEQIDGSRSVIEKYTDHLGNVFELFRQSVQGEDLQAALTQRTPLIDQMLIDSEFESILNDP